MIDLTEIAKRAMIDKGLIPDFPETVLKETAQLSQSPLPNSLKDLRQLLWVSIDNDDSRDLDQLTFAESREGKDIIYVAVADVSGLVQIGSAIDQYAAQNTTSVYTPTKVFPMLPQKLSFDLTSLNENTDRASMVVEMEIGHDGSFTLIDVYPALVRNHAKLAYNGVAAFLSGKGTINAPRAILEQLQVQDKIAKRIKEFRYRQGALGFVTIELEPILQNGEVVDLRKRVHNRAHALIENYMIAANSCVTHFFTQQKMPTFRRIVRTPKKWDRVVHLAKLHNYSLPHMPDAIALRDFLQKQQRLDPDHFPDLSLCIIKLIGRGEYVLWVPGEPAIGHFDLALIDYAHTTAPNRRFPDLIMQRLLKSHLFAKKMPYDLEGLAIMAENCTEKEDAATKVERRMLKSAAAMVLSNQIGKEFTAMITGSGIKGTWVRLDEPPIEGKLIAGHDGLDVGDRLTVKLVEADITNGFIDFVKA